MAIFSWNEYDGDVLPPVVDVKSYPTTGYPIDKTIERKNAKGRLLSNVYHTSDRYMIEDNPTIFETQGDQTPWIDLSGATQVNFLLWDIRPNGTRSDSIFTVRIYGSNKIEKPDEATVSGSNIVVNDGVRLKTETFANAYGRRSSVVLGEGTELPLTRWVMATAGSVNKPPRRMHVQVFVRRMQPLKEWDR